MILKRLKIVAAITALIYIIVQTFQWWVFAKVPPGTDLIEKFLDGNHPLNITRSWLMLLSMFGLWFIFFVVCYINYHSKKVHSLLAFISFSVFSFLEITLRSVELFYVQKSLPLKYLETTDELVKQGVMNTVEAFTQVQSALYFPLGFCWMIGSLLIAISFSGNNRASWVIKLSFWINTIRLFLRQLTVYFGINLFPDNMYYALYLPMVIITFGFLAYGLLRSRNTKILKSIKK